MKGQVLNRLNFLLLLFPVSILAQTWADNSAYKVFSPDENSIHLNQAYVQNFFFGNFGLRQLINAVPINNEKVKNLKIAATGKDFNNTVVMEFQYDEEGRLTQMKVFKSFFGDEMTVNYTFREGLIETEKIMENGNEKINKFYYSNRKMNVENYRNIMDVYSLNGKMLFKDSYMDGKLIFSDTKDGQCRKTYYLRKPISQICYSNFNLNVPLKIEEFTTGKDKNSSMKKEKTLEIEKLTNLKYAIYINGTASYQLNLNQESKVESFQILENKLTRVKPVKFSFNYTYYQ